jgi:hypothetical protein
MEVQRGHNLGITAKSRGKFLDKSHKKISKRVKKHIAFVKKKC